MSSPVMSDPAPDADAALAQEVATQAGALVERLAQRIFGQAETIEQMVVTLLAGGHGLLIGVPGLGKTTLVQELAAALGLKFARLQFTPDLMPADITGTDVMDVDADGRRSFRFVPGPLFANVVLGDEINRTPPKTQAALLQAMQEGSVTGGGTTHPLPSPFHVFATQNPAEQHGTYPLPEAQLDRFMLVMELTYPDFDAEVALLRRTPAAAQAAPLPPLWTATQLQAIQSLVGRVPVADAVLAEAVRLVRATRPGAAEAPAEVRSWVSQGAGSRAAQHLLRAAQARALLQGRAAVDHADVHALAVPVLRHRLALSFAAQGEGIGALEVLQHLLLA